MTSTTSGTYDFTLDVDEFIEEALDVIGGDYTNGSEQKKARRTLNLYLIELINKRVPVHTVDTISTTLVASTASYDLGNSINSILEANLKTTSSGTETPLSRYQQRDYHRIPNKTREGRPSSFYSDRNTDTTLVTLWPVPDVSSTYTLETLVAKRIEDVNASYQKIAVPYRYYPLIVAGLRYKLAMKKDDMDPNKFNVIISEYQRIEMDTWANDKEREDFHFFPTQSGA